MYTSTPDKRCTNEYGAERPEGGGGLLEGKLFPDLYVHCGGGGGGGAVQRGRLEVGGRSWGAREGERNHIYAA
jgi:hypothetical protein